MATQTDEIVVRFKTEGGETVEEAFKRNASAADQYHQKVTKVGGALGDLRLKAEARVANNIGAIAQAMTGGASAGEIFATAITKASESFRGSLLFAAGATAGFAIYQGLVKAGEAVIALDTSIARLKTTTLGRGDFLGSDQVKSNLDEINAKFQTFTSQLRSENVGASGGLSHLGRVLAQAAGDIGAGDFGALFGNLNERDQKRLNALRIEAAAALGQQADKQSALNDVTAASIDQGEHQVALLQIERDYRERIGVVAQAEAVTGQQGRSPARQAEEDRRTNLLTLEQKRVDLQVESFRTQTDVIGIEKELLPAAEENLKILDARIGATKELLDNQKQLSPEEKIQYNLQLGQLEATKQRAEFARQLETDLAGLELGRTRGEVGSNRAAILERQRLADQAAAQNPNSPESQRAQAGLENEQFSQFQEYEKNPGAFRQKRINEQHERDRFQYLRATGQLSSDIASSGSDIRTPDQRKGTGNDLPSKMDRLIQTLLALPQKIGVG